MSESKWTPGPWHIAEDRDAEVMSGDGNLIAQCFGSYSHNTVHQIDANCRLIAAAPDLAEVAEELIRIDANLSGQQRDDAMSDLIVKARAALAKAEVEA